MHMKTRLTGEAGVISNKNIKNFEVAVKVLLWLLKFSKIKNS